MRWFGFTFAPRNLSILKMSQLKDVTQNHSIILNRRDSFYIKIKFNVQNFVAIQCLITDWSPFADVGL